MSAFEVERTQCRSGDRDGFTVHASSARVVHIALTIDVEGKLRGTLVAACLRWISLSGAQARPQEPRVDFFAKKTSSNRSLTERLYNSVVIDS